MLEEKKKSLAIKRLLINIITTPREANKKDKEYYSGETRVQICRSRTVQMAEKILESPRFRSLRVEESIL